MKRTHSVLKLLCVMVVTGFYLSSAAQTSQSEQVTITGAEKFNPHFFLQLQAGGAYTVGEAKFDKLLSPAAAANLGYRFTPVFGLRAGVSGWQGRGAWVNPRHDYKFNYLQGNVDAMLSLTNLFCGSNPTRTLDFYAFLGVGAAGGFHNNEAVSLEDSGFPLGKVWRGKHVFPAGRGGLGVDINLNRNLAINVEVNANMLSDRFNSKEGSKFDWQYNALVGITYSFGGRSKKIINETVETVITQVVEEEVPVEEPAPAPKQETQPAIPLVPATMTQDIFFTINSSVISKDERGKVEALINYMKEYPETTVTVTGYADKGTGYAAYNMKISEARAGRVAEMLKEAGIAASRITVVAKGDTEQPFEINAKNRVAIAIAK